MNNFSNSRSSNISKVITILAISLSLASGEGTSSIRYLNMTSAYSAYWFTSNVGGTLKLVMTLRYKDYEITNWGT